jgi:hypothetical protein
MSIISSFWAARSSAGFKMRMSYGNSPPEISSWEYVEKDEGGPLLSFWDPNDETDLARNMAYDATCRKLYKFLTAMPTTTLRGQ